MTILRQYLAATASRPGLRAKGERLLYLLTTTSGCQEFAKNLCASRIRSRGLRGYCLYQSFHPRCISKTKTGRLWTYVRMITRRQH